MRHPGIPTRGPIRSSMLAAGLVAMAAHAPLAGADVREHNYFTPMLSYALADDDRLTDDGFGGVIALGSRFSPYLAAEIRGSYLTFDSDEEERGLVCGLLNTCPQVDDTELYGGGIGLNLYPFAGGLYLHVDAMAGTHGQYHGGVGYEFGGASGMSLVAEALYHMSEDYDDTRFNLGLKFPFGASAEPAPEPDPYVPPPEPEPVRVVEPPDCELPAGAGEPVDFAGCEIGDTIVLEGVNFDFDKATLTPESTELLDRVIDALLARPDIKVEVRGHTDSMGSDSYNEALSDRRANSVMRYLQEGGIPSDRMTARGFGESEPIADNDTELGRSRNRRAELYISDANPPEGGTTTAPARAAPTMGDEVVIRDGAFQPNELYVTPGTRVKWQNETSSSQTVEFFGDSASYRIPPGDFYSKVFDRVGTYSYASGIYPEMETARIIVKHAEDMPTASPAPAPAPDAAEDDTVDAVDAAMAQSGGAGRTVRIEGYSYVPATITVPAGTTVTWQNSPDNRSHTVSSLPGGESGALAPGASFSMTFDTPGTYPYGCDFHSAMSGTVVVE